MMVYPDDPFDRGERMDTRRAAEYMGYNPDYLVKLFNRGVIKAWHPMVRGRWQVWQADLDAHLAKRNKSRKGLK